MNPALLAAINGGGGKPPSKVSKKDKVKKKAPPKRPDQKVVEKPNPGAGRVVSANYKPSPNKPAASGHVPAQSAPQNGALLQNILAAKQNMKKGGSKPAKSKSKPAPTPKIAAKSNSNSKPTVTRKQSNAKSSTNSVTPPKSNHTKQPSKKWGIGKKSPKPTKAPTIKPSRTPSIASNVSNTSQTSKGGSSDDKALKSKISSLEDRNKYLEKQLDIQQKKETQLMEKIVKQQNDYNKLLKDHKTLTMEFEKYKQNHSNHLNKANGGTMSQPKKAEPKKAEPKPAAAAPAKKDGKKWGMFGNKKNGNAAAAPPKVEKKPSVPKAAKPPKPAAKPSKSSGGKSGGGGGGKGSDIWKAYCSKFGNPPTDAKQLIGFSKTANFPNLNYKEAREIFEANK